MLIPKRGYCTYSQKLAPASTTRHVGSSAVRDKPGEKRKFVHYGSVDGIKDYSS
jgi:hypothetical protein